MKRFCFLLMLATMLAEVRGQVMFDFKINPTVPSINDSIESTFTIGFGMFGSKKYSGHLDFYGDTLMYNGCYLKPCCAVTDSYIFDTVNIGKLPVGYYEFFVLRNFVFNIDSFCSNAAFSDTLDTFIVVTGPNSIDLPTRFPFYASLLSYNKLKIVTDETGELAISVYDAPGRKIYNRQMPLQQKESAIDLDLPELPRGIYFYAVVVNEKRKVLRFVKQ